jgi:hypothetical protein
MAASALARRPSTTNRDVIDAIGELHDCLHAVDKKIDEVKTDVAHTRERVAKIEGWQSGIATKLRVGDPDERRSFVRRHKWTLTSIGALLGAIVAFFQLYPYLRGMLLAFDAAVMAVK